MIAWGARDSGRGPFVRTGAVGRLRQRDGVTFAALVELAGIWSRDDRVEPLGFVDGPLLTDGIVPASTEPVWLACSADGTHPLTHAIEGRFVSDLASSPTFHSASGFVGFSELSASSIAWAGPSRVFRRLDRQLLALTAFRVRVRAPSCSPRLSSAGCTTRQEPRATSELEVTGGLARAA